MKKTLCLIAMLTLVACTPKPPIYITPKNSSGIAKVKSAKLQILPIEKIDLHDFKRAFIKKYGTEDEFKSGFQSDLSKQLALETANSIETHILEITKLDVDSHVVSSTMMVGGGPNIPGHMVTNSTEYCVINIDFRVRSSTGDILLEGCASESTAKGEFLHPNQSKLANAISGVQRHLVDYLRGRMPGENIKLPDAPKV